MPAIIKVAIPHQKGPLPAIVKVSYLKGGNIFSHNKALPLQKGLLPAIVKVSYLKGENIASHNKGSSTSPEETIASHSKGKSTSKREALTDIIVRPLQRGTLPDMIKTRITSKWGRGDASKGKTPHQKEFKLYLSKVRILMLIHVNIVQTLN